MFEYFKQRYLVTSRLTSGPAVPIVTSPLESTPGYEEFMREYAGATFNNGLYRVHALENRAKWTRLIEEAFPTCKGTISAFGYDWVGRQFALDANQRKDGEPLILMCQPGGADMFEIPCTFLTFHEDELINNSDAPLADVAFRDWIQAGNRAPGPTECVGYKVPLFLGGVDDFENYEVCDMEVYWGITTQFLEVTRNLPPGTPIGRVTIK